MPMSADLGNCANPTMYDLIKLKIVFVRPAIA